MADVYNAGELRTLSAELAAGKPLTAEVFIKLKATIKQEISRRKYKGSIVEFAGDSWDYTVQPNKEQPVLTEHYSKLQGPMDKIYPMALPNPAAENKNHELSALANRLAKNVETSLTSGNDCASSCTGLCHTACSGTCSGCGGSCSSGCGSGCTGDCDGNCGNQCSKDGCSSCTGGCSGGCNKTCTGGCYSGCGGACSNSCGGTCETGCLGGCTAKCSGNCVGQGVVSY